MGTKISDTRLFVMIEYTLLGMLLGFISYFSSSYGLFLAENILRMHFPIQALLLGALAFVIFLFVYSNIRGAFYKLSLFLGSKRFDLIFSFLAGGVLSFLSIQKVLSIQHDIFYYSPLSGENQLLIFIVTQFVVGLITTFLVFRKDRAYVDNNSPLFLSDKEKELKSEDALENAEKAVRFARQVQNGGASDSLVFGVDASWGSGKTSFVNFCIETWNEEYNGQVIVYQFNPLHHSNKKTLLKKFIDGLVKELKKSSFIPELTPLISKYGRYILSAKEFTLFGIKLRITNSGETLEDLFEQLSNVLLSQSKRLVVVVDDLDRLDFEETKEILFVIKKSFNLPNISYILCYDTENISSFSNKDRNANKISEFLEKFINIKINLFVSRKSLISFFTASFATAEKRNLFIDPMSINRIRRIAHVVETEIYNSSNFYKYRRYLGDIRKVKRFINTLLLFDVLKTKFKDSDIFELDLIHLILIYINYPKMFRDIVDSETDGVRGVFSAVTKYDKGFPEDKDSSRDFGDGTYQNSDEFREYLKGKNEHQLFLLKKVFDLGEVLEDRVIRNLSTTTKRVRACFNGSGWGDGANLQDYLRLVSGGLPPDLPTQHTFYLNTANKVKEGVSIEDVLKEDGFGFGLPETNRHQLWNVITNDIHNFPEATARKLADHILNTISEYSYLEIGNTLVDLRHLLTYHLAKIINTSHWSTASSSRENNEKNISEIARKIFGEDEYADSGVIDVLASEERGVLGFYDVLLFRLRCSADRGNDLHNITNALVNHSDQNKNTQQLPLNELAKAQMREMSQHIFGLFRRRYICPQANIFEEVSNLRLQDFTGRYAEALEKAVRNDNSLQDEVNDKFLTAQKKVVSFILYQIGNSKIDMGVGAGIYDPVGIEDSSQIRKEVSKYMIDVCFNPSISDKGYDYFLDYMFRQTMDGIFRDEVINPYSESSVTNVMTAEDLGKFWKINKEEIRDTKAFKLHKEPNKLEKLCEILDQIAESIPGDDPEPTEKIDEVE